MSLGLQKEASMRQSTSLPAVSGSGSMEIQVSTSKALRVASLGDFKAKMFPHSAGTLRRTTSAPNSRSCCMQVSSDSRLYAASWSSGNACGYLRRYKAPWMRSELSSSSLEILNWVKSASSAQPSSTTVLRFFPVPVVVWDGVWSVSGFSAPDCSNQSRSASFCWSRLISFTRSVSSRFSVSCCLSSMRCWPSCLYVQKTPRFLISYKMLLIFSLFCFQSSNSSYFYFLVSWYSLQASSLSLQSSFSFFLSSFICFFNSSRLS